MDKSDRVIGWTAGTLGLSLMVVQVGAAFDYAPAGVLPVVALASIPIGLVIGWAVETLRERRPPS
jgi:hypothetical protein